MAPTTCMPLITSHGPSSATTNATEKPLFMAEPAIFDGRNLYKPSEVAEAGFYYESIGRPIAHPNAEQTTDTSGGV